MFSIDSKKICSVCFIFLTVSHFVVTNLFAQQSYWLRYPARSIIPNHLNTSQYDGMGLIEIVKTDPIRAIFINPAKITEIENDLLFLSGSSFNKSQSHFYNQNYYTEDFKSNLSYINLPIGSILTFDQFAIGFLVAYGLEEQRERQMEKYSYSSSPTQYLINSETSDFLYQLITGINFNDAFSVGLSFSG